MPVNSAYCNYSNSISHNKQQRCTESLSDIQTTYALASHVEPRSITYEHASELRLHNTDGDLQRSAIIEQYRLTSVHLTLQTLHRVQQ
jgi:hypothetical protein